MRNTLKVWQELGFSFEAISHRLHRLQLSRRI